MGPKVSDKNFNWFSCSEKTKHFFCFVLFLLLLLLLFGVFFRSNVSFGDISYRNRLVVLVIRFDLEAVWLFGGIEPAAPQVGPCVTSSEISILIVQKYFSKIV